jgi:peptidoglycan endopeptidase LytF
MSRRDTIIVAALINAGLLIILFVSALKNPGPSDIAVHVPEKISQPYVDMTTSQEPKVVIGDEVDQVLSQYSKPNPLQQAAVAAASETFASEPMQPIEPVIASSAASSFVEDLNAIAKAPEASSLQETAAATQPANTSGFVEVRVKKGDVLEKIARNHRTSVQEIMKINKLSSTSLKIGQVLKVPSSIVVAKTATVKESSVAQTSDSAVKYYTVKSGDNPWTIAVKNHIKVEELLRLNNMDEAKARKLKPGDQIRIR